MSDASRREFMRTAGAALGALSMTGRGAEAVERTIQRPNILFFFPDQHRYDWTGANPDVPVRTPVLDALSERGTRFTNCYCASPVCSPSRACLASGKEYDRCPAPTNAEIFPPEETSFYELLRDAGYHTTGCGKFDLNKGEQVWGLDGTYRFDEWGFVSGINNAGKWDAINSGKDVPEDPYMQYLEDHGLRRTHVDDFLKRKNVENGQFTATFPTPLPAHAYCDNYIGQNGLNLLDGIPVGQPWFMQVNFAGPHPPVDVTKKMYKNYKRVDFPQPNRSTQYTPEVHNEIRKCYAAMIENIDEWLGAYLDHIDARGELDNTIIIFSSDHGEMLGDHNKWSKSKPYQASVGVPLTIAGPGVQRGVVSDALVSVMDIAATSLDYAQHITPAWMDSRSVRPLLEGHTDSHRDYLFSGLHYWRTVFDGQYKLTRHYPKQGDTSLFDIPADPVENNDLTAAAPNHVAHLQAILDDQAATAGT